MRSSPSRPEPLTPPAAGFAHRGLHGPGVPENSLAAFRAAIALGAGIECDVRLSADDVPVIVHDADLTRLCGEAGRVAKLSAATLAGKRLLGTSETIPRLADLLMIAAGRTPLLIELKSESGNAARLTAAVCRTLGARPGPVGIMSFDPRVGDWLARHRPDLRRGLILSGREQGIARWMKMLVSRPDFLALGVPDLGAPWVRRSGLPVYVWTISDAVGRAWAGPRSTALIWEADGRP